MTTTAHPPRRQTFQRHHDFIPENVRVPCRDVDPELFFPLPTDPGDKAKAVCRRCPVKVKCGEWAIDAGLNDGIFGGLDPEQRKARRRLGVLTR